MRKKIDVAVIGGGISGMEAASTLSRMGISTALIEEKDKFGGHVGKWDRLFPDGIHANELLKPLYDSLEGVETYLNTTVSGVTREQNRYVLTLSDETVLDADAVLLATGFSLFAAQRKEEYGYGIYDNVITSMELEQMFKQRKVVCKNGNPPKRVAFVHCVGSRDEKVDNRHCSKVCCATAVKQACEIRQLLPDSQVYNLYMDLRMFDRRFEDMYHEAQSKYHVNFIRGRLSEAGENKEQQVVLKAEDTLAGKPLKLTVDLLVLMAGMEASQMQKSLNAKLGLRAGADGFLETKNLFTQSNMSNVEGIFVAGTCTGAKTIPETLADARAAAGFINAYLMS